MPFDGLRRAEMRELKCGLNLPSVIGQTLSFLVANPRPSGIGPRSRRPNTPLPRRYSSKPGIAVFIGQHIFNRSFRNDVNARAIPRCGLIALMSAPCPLWVISGHRGTSASCPLYPRKRTSVERARKSARCHSHGNQTGNGHSTCQIQSFHLNQISGRSVVKTIRNKAKG
jgi:hypothetical protein